VREEVGCNIALRKPLDSFMLILFENRKQTLKRNRKGKKDKRIKQSPFKPNHVDERIPDMHAAHCR